MTKAQELMKQIDMLRNELSKPDGIIDERRQAAAAFGPDCDTVKLIQVTVQKYEDEIERLLREYWELMDEDAESARKEADHMAQSAVDRDVDGIKLLKELGYKGASENVIEALVELKSEGYTLHNEDVDVLTESVNLVRKHLSSVGIDVPFIDDCAQVASHHISELRSSLVKLAIRRYNTKEERDHRDYEVEKTECRVCKHSVTTAILHSGGWQQTGKRLQHAEDCVVRNLK